MYPVQQSALPDSLKGDSVIARKFCKSLHWKRWKAVAWDTVLECFFQCKLKLAFFFFFSLINYIRSCCFFLFGFLAVFTAWIVATCCWWQELFFNPASHLPNARFFPKWERLFFCCCSKPSFCNSAFSVAQLLEKQYLFWCLMLIQSKGSLPLLQIKEAWDNVG